MISKIYRYYLYSNKDELLYESMTPYETYNQAESAGKKHLELGKRVGLNYSYFHVV